MSFIASHRILLSRIFAIAVFLFFLFSGPSWDTSGLLDEIIGLAGLALVVVGAFGRIWSSVYIYGRKTDELVTVGPYSATRNPLYFFSLIGAVGLGLASKNIVIFGLIILAFLGFYPFVIRSEERKLERKHGKAFREYASAVPRYLPRFSLLEQPDVYELYARKFTRVFWDAMWFFWIFIIMQIVEKLHALDIMPVLWHLP